MTESVHAPQEVRMDFIEWQREMLEQEEAREREFLLTDGTDARRFDQ